MDETDQMTGEIATGEMTEGGTTGTDGTTTESATATPRENPCLHHGKGKVIVTATVHATWMRRLGTAVMTSDL